MLAADESVAPVVFGRPAPTHHILLVDMNAFFAAIEQRCNPALVGQPVLVCGNATNRTVVTAASYEARPYGIESGMPLFQALPRCPHAVVIEADPLKYIDIARGIQAILLRFSPTVEIYSIDEAFLTIPAHEDPVAAARAIKAAIRAEFLLTCSVGIGPNRLLAKMASGMQKPDGLVWFRAEEVPAHFAALPVKKLPGVGGRLERALHGMGLYTAGQLGRAPTTLLVSRFGFVMGNYLHQLGNGIDPTPVHSCFTPPPIRSMGHSYTLAKDTHDPDEMRAHLLRLAWAVGRRLRAEGYAGRVVRVMARYSDFTSCVREHRFRDDFDQPLAIYRAALAIIARWDAWARPIRALGVAVADLRTGARQMQLPLENGRTGERENGHDAVRTPDDRRPLSLTGRGVRAAGVRENQGTGKPDDAPLRFTGRAPLSGLNKRGNRSPFPLPARGEGKIPLTRPAATLSRGGEGTKAHVVPLSPTGEGVGVRGNREEGRSGIASWRERALLIALDAICDKYGEKALLPATLVRLKESREGRWSSELGPARNNHKPLGSRRFLLT